MTWGDAALVRALTVQMDSSGCPSVQQMLLSFSLGSDSWTSLCEMRAFLDERETMEATLCRRTEGISFYFRNTSLQRQRKADLFINLLEHFTFRCKRFKSPRFKTDQIKVAADDYVEEKFLITRT